MLDLLMSWLLKDLIVIAHRNVKVWSVEHHAKHLDLRCLEVVSASEESLRVLARWQLIRMSYAGGASAVAVGVVSYIYIVTTSK
jgi:hypothetical protein